MDQRDRGWVLAQLNVARLLAPIDSPQLADFVASLDAVNAVADQAPGFVWRLQDDGGNATSIQPWGQDVIVNLSVWESLQALQDYVFRSSHVEILRRRREWFAPYGSASLVLWWVLRGHTPDLDEAKERLDLLDRVGPSADAFTIRMPYRPPVRGRTA
jgi:Domain of unknown function (DUF3291)